MWWTRTQGHLAVTVGFAILILLLYFYSPVQTYTCIVSEILLFFLGVYLYYLINTRAKINAKHLIIVTGCDSGLGYSLALHCRFLGATVIAGVLEVDGKAAKNLTEASIIVRHLNITDNKCIKEFGEHVRTLLAQRKLVLHALINNAAVMIFGEFEWQTEEQIQHQIRVNLLGTMKITRELIPIIRANVSRIIMVSSHCASESLPGLSIYGATKAAIHAWATSLRLELGKHGVKVISFIPGSFTKESNITSQQRLHFESMEKSMLHEAKNFYGDYFTRYVQYFSSLPHVGNPKSLTNLNIYQTFNGAILDVYPRAIYKCEPWRYFFYFILFKNTPTWMRDRLVQRFIQAPSW